MTQLSRFEQLRDEAGPTVKLALPVVVARAGVFLMVMVDTIMVGQHAVTSLAAYGLAVGPTIPLMLMGIGFVTGTVILVAQRYGAEDFTGCGLVLATGLRQATLYGAMLFIAFQFGEPFLLALGQSPQLAEPAGHVVSALGFGMPAVMLHIVTSQFLEALGRPLPGMILMIIGNGVNALLNYLLIFGIGAAPELGAYGAALATSAVRWCLLLGLLGFIYCRVDTLRYGLQSLLMRVLKPGDRALSRRMRAIGLPIAITQGLESGAFAAMMIFAGWLGAVHVAAYQVAINLIALPFMAAQGVSTAASVRVGRAAGRYAWSQARAAGWTAMCLIMLLHTPIALAYWLFPTSLSRVFTDDPTTLLLLTPAIVAGACVLIPDAVQGVLIGALRGLADVWAATGLFLVAFWGIMVPAGYLLAVSAGWGTTGLVVSIGLGCIVASAMLGIRFHRVVSRFDFNEADQRTPAN